MNTIRAMLEERKLIVICRGVYGDILFKTVEALYEGGIRLAGVTSNQKSRDYKETLDTITMPEEHFRGRMAIGAGTVISPVQVKLAYRAKAVYIISSNVNETIVRKTKELGMLSIPGVLGPSEMLDMHEYGADYTKLFPAVRVTASYIKDLMGPISYMKSITAAGIIGEDVARLTAVGCIGYGISERSMNERVTQKGRFEELRHHAEAFIACLQREEE